VSLSFDPQAGLIVVPTRIWGPAGETVARLALDTGVTWSLLSWDVAVLLGYDPSIVQERLQIVTASGVEFVPTIGLQKLEALDRTCEGFPILCHTLPMGATVDGLLGLNFFQGHRLVADFREATVTLD
jgi:hypothetical protein